MNIFLIFSGHKRRNIQNSLLWLAIRKPQILYCKMHGRTNFHLHCCHILIENPMQKLSVVSSVSIKKYFTEDASLILTMCFKYFHQISYLTRHINKEEFSTHTVPKSESKHRNTRSETTRIKSSSVAAVTYEGRGN